MPTPYLSNLGPDGRVPRAEPTSGTAVRFQTVIPVLSVHDVDEACAWYKDVLGFDIGWSWGSPPTIASVFRDGMEFNLGLRGESGPPTYSVVYVQMMGVTAYHEAVRGRGARISSPLRHQPYGMIDFEITDPSGNRITFGETTTS
ncbi:MAG: glyoxalase superfamily protein [Gemmatimonadaceae bacterium]|nr:glyoxalase superfamily protein [Gemmatimonadaceae bacterium]